MRKLLGVSCLLVLCLTLLTGPSGCEQVADKAVGIESTEKPKVDAAGQPVIDPKTGKQQVEIVVTQKPLDQTPAGRTLDTVGGVAGKIFPGSDVLIHGIGYGVLTVLAGILAARAKSQGNEKTALQNDLDVANAAISATGAGLQQVANLLPKEHAETLAHVLDVAHDAMGVAEHLQDLIQPSLATAGAHAPDPA